MVVAGELACPQCRTTLPVTEGYVTWCHECGWNLNAPEPELAAGRLARLHESVGRRMGDRMAARLLSEKRLEPRLTPARAGAFAVATIVHVLALGLLVAGIALVVATFPNPFLVAAGVFLVGAALLMRPRFGELPDEGVRPRDEIPAVYALADDVAEALGTRRVDVVCVEHSFNAGWGIVGLRRRRLLLLGAPLVAGLEPQERVALIAHELAHGRNGDSTRGLYVGSAIGSLGALYVLLAPGEVDEWQFGGLERLLNGFFWLISRPVLGLLLLQLHLVHRDSQRAEFLADALAADVAGSDAVVGLTEKLLLEPTFQGVVQRASQGAFEADAVLDEVARSFTAVPPRERERRRRVARLKGARLLETHPPTAARIRLLEERPRREPRVLLEGERAEAFARDLERLGPEIGRRLVDEYRDALYER